MKRHFYNNILAKARHAQRKRGDYVMLKMATQYKVSQDGGTGGIEGVGEASRCLAGLGVCRGGV